MASLVLRSCLRQVRLWKAVWIRLIAWPLIVLHRFSRPPTAALAELVKVKRVALADAMRFGRLVVGVVRAATPWMLCPMI
jgi:hypothetical protein